MATRKTKELEIAEFANNANILYQKNQMILMYQRRERMKKFAFLAIFVVCVLVIGFAEGIGR